MKYAFIVNPVSGRGKHEDGIISDIRTLISTKPDQDIKLYQTRGEKDATVLADLLAAEADGEITIFACGGDGTVQETANGIYGHSNAILGVVPAGSGNDFARQLARRYGGRAKNYLDLARQLAGKPETVDLIKLSWIEGGEEKSRLITNGINIGFDGNTAVLANDLRRLPGISGTVSYLLAAAINLAQKKGQKLRITADGRDFHTGDLLLATAANGGFCGGGVNSCPDADLSDGLIELLAIKDVTRRRFVALFPTYKAGKLFRVKGIEEIAAYTQAKDIIIEPMLEPVMKFVADGEILTTGAVRIDIVPQAIRVMTV